MPGKMRWEIANKVVGYSLTWTVGDDQITREYATKGDLNAAVRGLRDLLGVTEFQATRNEVAFLSVIE